ncbi:MAG TPA: hypothetical protein DIC60_03150 [Lachnospiraceae bacterium]|nr:hypothetical protein [Lachnospiraceae bacterium]
MAEVNIDVAKEASVQTVNTKVGTSSDTASNTPTTMFAGIKGLIAWFTGTWTATRAGYIDTTKSLLENATYGLSALKTTLTGGSVPVVKSVQKGLITSGGSSLATYTVSISSINALKSFVILGTYSNSSDNTCNYVLHTLTNTNFTIDCYPYTNNRIMGVSWQVIEFY